MEKSLNATKVLKKLLKRGLMSYDASMQDTLKRLKVFPLSKDDSRFRKEGAIAFWKLKMQDFSSFCTIPIEIDLSIDMLFILDISTHDVDAKIFLEVPYPFSTCSVAFYRAWTTLYNSLISEGSLFFPSFLVPPDSEILSLLIPFLSEKGLLDEGTKELCFFFPFEERGENVVVSRIPFDSFVLMGSGLKNLLKRAKKAVYFFEGLEKLLELAFFVFYDSPLARKCLNCSKVEN